MIQNLARTCATLVVSATTLGTALPFSAAQAGTLYASGQAVFGPGHDHSSGNYFFRIDTATGTATPVSDVLGGSSPAALGGTSDGRLFGFAEGAVVDIDARAGSWTPVTGNTGLSATGFDVLADGRAYVTAFNEDFETQQLTQIDLTSGSISFLGSTHAIGNAIDLATGRELGTAEPFIISLGSIGEFLYGVDLDTYSLIKLDANTGAASIVGDVGAVHAGGRDAYEGFAGLSGFDSDDDGEFDELFGIVNYLDGERLGGLAKFDLINGTWSLVGSNPGLIFFGLGSTPVPVAVPEPAAIALFGAGVFGMGVLRRRREA